MDLMTSLFATVAISAMCSSSSCCIPCRERDCPFEVLSWDLFLVVVAAGRRRGGTRRTQYIAGEGTCQAKCVGDFVIGFLKFGAALAVLGIWDLPYLAVSPRASLVRAECRSPSFNRPLLPPRYSLQPLCPLVKISLSLPHNSSSLFSHWSGSLFHSSTTLVPSSGFCFRDKQCRGLHSGAFSLEGHTNHEDVLYVTDLRC